MSPIDTGNVTEVWSPTKIGKEFNDDYIPSNSIILTFGDGDWNNHSNDVNLEMKGTIPVDSSTGNIESSVISACQTEVDALWDGIELAQAPYACVETIKTSPTLTESLAYAYANLALFATIFVPLIAMLLVKLSGGSSSQKSKEDVASANEGGDAENKELRQSLLGVV